MKEIKVRGLSDATIHILTDMARNRGISRNEFIKEQLTLIATHPVVQEKEDLYRNLVKQLAVIIRQNTEVLSEFLGEYDSEK